MFRIEKTDDYLSLSRMFHENGLEIEVEETPPEGTLAMWSCVDEDTGELAAGSVLQMRSGVFVLADLAVNEEYRGTGLGLTMMNIAIKEAKGMGAEEIWGCAKIPEFYLRKGWREMDRMTSPEISKCQRCLQFNETCFPSIIRLELQEEAGI